METLLTVYWFCFGSGLIYTLVSGVLSAVSHTGHMPGGHVGDGLSPDGTGEAGGDGAAASHGGFGDQGDFGSADSSLEWQDGSALASADITSHEPGTPAVHIESAGAASEGGAEQSGNLSHAGLDYSPLSPLSLAGTLCGAGAGGLISLSYGASAMFSVLYALAGGISAALLLWLLVGKLLYGMQGSSEAHVADMAGLEATVLTPFKAGETGEIAYILDGTRYTAPARMQEEGNVSLHDTVRIRRLDGNIAYVEPRRKLLE